MLKYERYDFFLIWGHGYKFRSEIISIIEDHPTIEIHSIITHRPQNIKGLVKEIYSYDYAPFSHLKAKTKYLLTTPNFVQFIFVKNISPLETEMGEGEFKHIECLKIKEIKELIRNKFNERKNDRRTEDHVIHASDNEAQTHHILKYLGYKNGLKSILNKNKLFNIPHHIDKVSKVILRRASLHNLYARKLTDSGTTELVKLSQMPHYLSIINKSNEYDVYIRKHRGFGLTDYYSGKKFNSLISNLEYLKGNYPHNYILVKNENNQFIILDGVHRASILLSRNETVITVAEVKI